MAPCRRGMLASARGVGLGLTMPSDRQPLLFCSRGLVHVLAVGDFSDADARRRINMEFPNSPIFVSVGASFGDCFTTTVVSFEGCSSAKPCVACLGLFGESFASLPGVPGEQLLPCDARRRIRTELPQSLNGGESVCSVSLFVRSSNFMCIADALLFGGKEIGCIHFASLAAHFASLLTPIFSKAPAPMVLERWFSSSLGESGEASFRSLSQCVFRFLCLFLDGSLERRAALVTAAVDDLLARRLSSASGLMPTDFSCRECSLALGRSMLWLEPLSEWRLRSCVESSWLKLEPTSLMLSMELATSLAPKRYVDSEQMVGFRFTCPYVEEFI
mmetsp:Transcript_55351/g.155755  ORF Transcript_55351/g.155755 Transcript_55351/m.155755 type:complete len:331 (+) Transcript_55351:63-1055(+)